MGRIRASTYDSRFRAIQYEKYVAMLGEGTELGPGPWLDLGCGTGLLKAYLAEHGRGAAPLVGIDFSRTMRAHARTQALPVAEAGADALPFPDGVFSAVLAFTVLRIVSDPDAERRMLAEVARLLRRRGVLVLTVPQVNHDGAFPEQLRAVGLQPEGPTRADRISAIAACRTDAKVLDTSATRQCMAPRGGNTMDSNDTKLDRRNFIRTLAAAGVATGALTLEAASAEAASCPKLPKPKSSKEIVPVHIVSEVGDVIDGEMDLRTVDLEVLSDGSRSLSVELFFDGFEEGTDVHGSTDAVLKLALVHQELHRPPVAILTWGKGLSFKCMVQSGRTGFTMFLDDGTPVRATVRVQLQVFDDCTLGAPGTP